MISVRSKYLADNICNANTMSFNLLVAQISRSLGFNQLVTMRSKNILVAIAVLLVFILIWYWSSKSLLQTKSNISGMYTS